MKAAWANVSVIRREGVKVHSRYIQGTFKVSFTYCCLFERILGHLVSLRGDVEGRQEGNAGLGPMHDAPRPRPRENGVEQPQDGLLQVRTHAIQGEYPGQHLVHVFGEDFHRVGLLQLRDQRQEEDGSPDDFVVGGEVSDGGGGHFDDDGVLDAFFGVA